MKMKQNYLILLIGLLTFNNPLKAQHFDLIVGGSSSHFLGDLGGKPFLGTNDLQDLDILSTRYAITAGVRLNMGKVFALRTNLWYARLSADDKYTRNRERNGRNLSFFTQILEADAVLEMNIYKTADKKKIFYVFGGVGYFTFNPKTKLNGNVYTLRDFGTEGQYSVPGKSPYDLHSICFPMGFGSKFIINKRSYFTLEVNSRKTRTDYIDDVSTSYVDPNLLSAAKGPTAAALADRSVSDIPGLSSPGAIRGDPKDNDNFFFFSFSYNYTLGAGSNFGSYNRKGRPRNRINGKMKCFEF
jgi:hypothetical protein